MALGVLNALGCAILDAHVLLLSLLQRSLALAHHLQQTAELLADLVMLHFVLISC